MRLVPISVFWRKHRDFVVVGTIVASISLAMGWLSAIGHMEAAMSVMASFLGAAVAVWGAFWVTDYRESRQQRELQSVLGDVIFKLLSPVECLGMLHGGQWGPRNHDADVAYYATDLKLRRDQLLMFRPYTGLGDFEIVAAVAEVDAYTGTVINNIERILTLGSVGDPEQGRFSAQEMKRLSDSLYSICDEALKLLHHPMYVAPQP